MTLETAPATDTPESLEAAVDAALDAEFDAIDFEKPSEDNDLIEDAAPDDGAPEVEEEDTPDDPKSEDADAPETDTDSETAADEDEPQDIATLAPPARWDAKGKELYASLPADAQKYISARESVVQGEITRQQQERARLQLELHEAKSAPDTELSRLLNVAKSRYDTQYSGISEEAILEAVLTGDISNEQAFEIRQAKAQEAAAIKQLEDAAQQREAESLRALAETRALEIKANAPELATDVAAQERVVKFLTEAGYTAEQLNYAKSTDLIMAHKAMQWDELQAVKSKSKPAATRTGKVVKSAATQQSGNSKAQKMAALRRDGSPAALEKLVEMQLDEEFEL